MDNNQHEGNQYDHTAEPFVSTTEAAAIVGCHRATLVKLAAEGQVPAIRVGKTFRFQLSKVLEALAVSP